MAVSTNSVAAMLRQMQAGGATKSAGTGEGASAGGPEVLSESEAGVVPAPAANGEQARTEDAANEGKDGLENSAAPSGGSPNDLTDGKTPDSGAAGTGGPSIGDGDPVPGDETAVPGKATKTAASLSGLTAAQLIELAPEVERRLGRFNKQAAADMVALSQRAEAPPAGQDGRSGQESPGGHRPGTAADAIAGVVARQKAAAAAEIRPTDEQQEKFASALAGRARRGVYEADLVVDFLKRASEEEAAAEDVPSGSPPVEAPAVPDAPPPPAGPAGGEQEMAVQQAINALLDMGIPPGELVAMIESAGGDAPIKEARLKLAGHVKRAFDTGLAARRPAKTADEELTYSRFRGLFNELRSGRHG